MCCVSGGGVNLIIFPFSSSSTHSWMDNFITKLLNLSKVTSNNSKRKGTIYLGRYLSFASPSEITREQRTRRQWHDFKIDTNIPLIMQPSRKPHGSKLFYLINVGNSHRAVTRPRKAGNEIEITAFCSLHLLRSAQTRYWKGAPSWTGSICCRKETVRNIG